MIEGADLPGSARPLFISLQITACGSACDDESRGETLIRILTASSSELQDLALHANKPPAETLSNTRP